MNRWFRELSVAAALLVVLAALAVFAPGFYQPQPLLSLATREAPTLVVACGMALAADAPTMAPPSCHPSDGVWLKVPGG